MSFIVDIQLSTSLVLLFAIIHKCIFIFWCMLQTYRSSMCSHFYRNLFIHFNVSRFIFRGVVPTWFLDQHYFEMRTLLCLSLKRINTQCFPLKICGRQLSLRYCEKYRLLFIILWYGMYQLKWTRMKILMTHYFLQMNNFFIDKHQTTSY